MENLICTYCELPFDTLTMLKGHFKYSHKNISANDKAKEIERLKERILELPNRDKLLSNRKKNKSTFGQKQQMPKQHIEIYLNRSTKYHELTKCSICLTPHDLVWRFNNTSIGVAFLCSPCKKNICKPRSWIKVTSNSIETNRKKH